MAPLTFVIGTVAMVLVALPDFPNNLWPYIALAWVAVSWVVIKLWPALVNAPHPDYT